MPFAQCFPGHWATTLIFSGNTIGSRVQYFNSNFRYLTEIAERQNFWSRVPILDGSYPCLVWDHEISLYVETTNVTSYLEEWRRLHTFINSRPQGLKIQTTGNSLYDVVAFGDVYMKPPDQETPEGLMMFASGMWKLHFIGTEPFSVVTPVVTITY